MYDMCTRQHMSLLPHVTMCQYAMLTPHHPKDTIKSAVSIVERLQMSSESIRLAVMVLNGGSPSLTFGWGLYGKHVLACAIMLSHLN